MSATFVCLVQPWEKQGDAPGIGLELKRADAQRWRVA